MTYYGDLESMGYISSHANDFAKQLSPVLAGYGLGQLLTAPEPIDLGSSPGITGGILWNGLPAGAFVLPHYAPGTIVRDESGVAVGIIGPDGVTMMRSTTGVPSQVAKQGNPLHWPVYTDREQIQDRGEAGDAAILVEQGVRMRIAWNGKWWQRIDHNHHGQVIELPETLKRALARAGAHLIDA